MTPDQYRREGAEAMRKAAAKLAHWPARKLGAKLGSNFDIACSEAAEAIRTIDPAEVLAGLPTVTIAGGQAVVAVCPICDIAGCRHIREAEKAPDAVARLVEAASNLGPWISASMSDPYNPACEEYIKTAEAFLTALATMEADHD